MKFLKNTYKLFLVLCLVILGLNASIASSIQDVQDGFWAERAIVDCINRGYFKLDSSNKFYPNGTIQRGAFLNALLKVLESEDAVTGAKAYFKDMNENSPYKKDIAIAQNMGFVFGYPDKTFKPTEAITHSEATSVIANISKTSMNDKSILEQFSDSGEIPVWALDSYAKADTENLYVNHPDPSRFSPNSKMTRAEAAVLFAKMAGDFDVLKLKYSKAQEDILLSEETLNIYNKAPRNNVKIYNTKKIIEAGNVIIGHPVNNINTKTLKRGEIVVFEAPTDLYTEEGTLLYKAGAQFRAKVHRTKNRLWTNKQNKALFIFDYANYPNNTEKEMAAVSYTTNKGHVVFVTDANSKKKYKESSKKLSKGDFLLKYVDKLIPVVQTKIDSDENIYLLLTGDLIIPNNDDL